METFEKLLALHGYVEDGTDRIITTFKDDATDQWFIKAKLPGWTDRILFQFNAPSLDQAINKAYEVVVNGLTVEQVERGETTATLIAAAIEEEERLREELHQQQIEDAVGAIVQSEVDAMSEPMKALCRVCYDGYGDEEFCFGRCCGSTMVEVPKRMWDELDGRASREEINELIAKHGKLLIKE